MLGHLLFAVLTVFSLSLTTTESSTGDLGNAVSQVPVAYNFTWESGTGDSQADKVFTDTRTLSATSETLDLYGSLTGALGTTTSYAEVKLVYIRNKATSAASVLTIGNATNPAFSKLFGAAGYTAKVPAGGVFLWVAPYDGAGLVVTDTTADGLKIDSGAASVTYDIVIVGSSS